jgi:hypothetical protein
MPDGMATVGKLAQASPAAGPGLDTEIRDPARVRSRLIAFP